MTRQLFILTLRVRKEEMAKKAEEEKALIEEKLRQLEEERKMDEEEQQRLAEKERIRKEQEEQEKLAELLLQVGSNSITTGGGTVSIAVYEPP